ncbi:GntP family permease [Paracoccus sp. MBLB3053]|uniref:GntP family permease n=1 Tax=Paracoccus aurantius TaxID=3073814 RepID=A0ABU2HYM6_9RHOB|nr:GntP family permease [Paracoccus sp. MBLB3053]MDS9469399.1 GntP family permease [Paracoccus sp. MBLB3053]
MGIAIILLALFLLIVLAYRGGSILVLSPLLAVGVAAASGEPVLASYTQTFMNNTGGFIVTYFPLFLLGAIFGKLMEVSGAAAVIGEVSVRILGEGRAMLAIILSCAVLTYGGVSLFVVAFAVYPIAAAVFRRADLPARLIPGTIALGAFTFTMTALPGTPAIQNAIPMPYFGTTPFAAPGLGIVAALVMLALGYAWLKHRSISALRAGEGFDGRRPVGVGADVVRDAPQLPEGDTGQAGRQISPPLALLPIVLVIVTNFLLSKWIFPAADLSYLAEPRWDGLRPQDVIGVWSIIISLTVACLLVLVLNARQGGLRGAVSEGAHASLMPIFNTASLVGFGAVIAALPAFAAIRDALMQLSGGNPLISLSIAVNILAGITGSASGGMSIALDAMGDQYLALGRDAGIPPEFLHRVTSVATGGLDALPHNGAVVTLLGICGMTHAKSYLDIFVVAVAGPLVALVAIITLASL